MAAGDYRISLKNIKMGATSKPEEGTNIDEVNSTVTAVVQNYDVLLDENSTVAPESSNGTVTVLVKRTIKADEWSTICLPFAMTEEQCKAAFGDDVQIADFTGYETEEDADENFVGITVNFTSATAIEANHPYIIKVTEPVTEFTVDGVDIDPEEEPTVAAIKRTRKQWSEFIGTYVANTTLEGQMLFLSGSNFWYSTGATTMKAFRAYFDFCDVLTDVENALSAARIFISFSNETTGVSEKVAVTDDETPAYSLSGQRVMNPKKGLYIKNDKKIVVR